MGVIPVLQVILAADRGWLKSLVDQFAATLAAIAALAGVAVSWSAQHKAKQAERNTRNIGNGFADNMLSGQQTTHDQLDKVQRVLARVDQRSHAAAERADLAAELAQEAVHEVRTVDHRLSEHIAAQDGRVREHPREPPAD